MIGQTVFKGEHRLFKVVPRQCGEQRCGDEGERRLNVIVPSQRQSRENRSKKESRKRDLNTERRENTEGAERQEGRGRTHTKRTARDEKPAQGEKHRHPWRLRRVGWGQSSPRGPPTPLSCLVP